MSNRDEWVSPWWQAVCLPDEWDVCGVAVPSLSVWHVFALINLDCAYIAGGTIDHDAATTLLLVASCNMRQGRQYLLRPRAMMRDARKIAARLRKMSADDIQAACGDYVDACMRRGTRMSRGGEGGGSPCGSPEAWTIVSAMAPLMTPAPRSLFNWHPSTALELAWDTPYAVGRAFIDALDERAGNTTMTPWLYGEEMVDNWDRDYKDQTGTKELRIG